MIDLHPGGRGSRLPLGHLCALMFPMGWWLGVGSSPSKVCGDPQATFHCHQADPSCLESWIWMCARSFLKASRSKTEKLHSPIHSGAPYSRARLVVRRVCFFRSRFTAEMGRDVLWTSRP